jgi:ATP-dependent RNA helicase DBP3
MAATKHSLAESEASGGSELARPSKKLKVKESNEGLAVDNEERKSKKDKKKDKEEKKKRKEDRKRKSLVANGQEMPIETPVEDADAEAQAEAKRLRKEKKKAERKSKREEEMQKGASQADVAEGKPEKKKKKKKEDGKRSQKEDAEPASTVQETSSNASQADVDSFMKEHLIVVTDPKSNAEPSQPIIEFSHLKPTALLKKSPFKAYKSPTPIQAASWPFTLAGRDVIGVAETGSGKTLAFALPCVESVSSLKHKGIKAVIVSPTRELAMQTHEQTSKLAALAGLKCVCIYGGESKDIQRGQIKKGADIIVATPGRLMDFMEEGAVVLSGAKFVVLDEADRMLDKGFEEDIKRILSSTPSKEERQTLMFTATWPATVQALASSFMVNPVKITIGSGGKETASGAVELQANIRISQTVEVIERREKEHRLLQLIKQHQQANGRNDRILVFCLYKKEATRVEDFLKNRGQNVGGIHGDLRQAQRTQSLEAFKTGKTPVLVATDVAARGLDIPEVKLVINVTVSRCEFTSMMASYVRSCIGTSSNISCFPPSFP